MTTDGMSTPGTRGLVMHSQARWYDLLAWLLTLGRERSFRERLVELAALKPGDTVLDVGCGTGSLAVAAKRRVGAAGTVYGIDASPEMIARAKRKAAKAGADVVFSTGTVEALPFPDARFDAVMSTLMLHHLPRAAREQCAREVRRVLKPGGRVLAVDFAKPAGKSRGLFRRFHRHGHLALGDIVTLLSDVGLTVTERGAVGVLDLQFAVATLPGLRDHDRHDLRTAASRSLGRLPLPRWVWPVLAIVLVASHGIVLRLASTRMALSAVAVMGVAGLLVIMHFRFGSMVHTLLRRRARR